MEEKIIKTHMTNLLNSNFCIDNRTGEVDCTKLAEMTADDLDLYMDDEEFTIPEEIFDYAVEVGEKFK